MKDRDALITASREWREGKLYGDGTPVQSSAAGNSETDTPGAQQPMNDDEDGTARPRSSSATAPSAEPAAATGAGGSQPMERSVSEPSPAGVAQPGAGGAMSPQTAFQNTDTKMTLAAERRAHQAEEEISYAPKLSGRCLSLSFLRRVIGRCRELAEEGDENPWRGLVRLVGEDFGSAEKLAHAFLLPEDRRLEEDLPQDRISAELRHDDAPAVLASESPSSPAPASSLRSGMDTEAIIRAYTMLMDVPDANVESALVNAHVRLVDELKPRAGFLGLGALACLRPLLVLALSPLLADPSHNDRITVPLFETVSALPDPSRDALIQWCSRLSYTALEQLIHFVQQHISVRIVSGPVRAPDMAPPVAFMAVLNNANELHYRRHGRRVVPFTEFYNEVVNDEIFLQEGMVRSDYMRWKQSKEGQDMFSFCAFPFILNAAAKSSVLAEDAKIQMRNEARRTLLDSFQRGELGESPYFELNVNRDNVVEDALTQVVNVTPKTKLKRPLRVRFAGEDGVDEGGVRKEFFQVMVRQVFTPDFGMFQEEESTRFLWPRPGSLGSPVQWELMGSIIGLATYNSVILNLNFPLVLYRKLLGEPVTLRDLDEFRPQVASGLRYLLEYQGDDVESAFGLAFSVEYETWGVQHEHELKPGGASITVTKDNREEYVDLFVHWTLVEQIRTEFEPFHRGFLNVTGGDALELFRAEELERLVTGSKELDFHSLEESVRYDDGYDKNSEVVKWFWEVLHSFSDRDKKRFLAFATGSDRAPIRGLGSLRFVISRAGPDSERLPSAHTCFQHLLLPQYSSKEKLEDKLRKAIQESEGFGLL